MDSLSRGHSIFLHQKLKLVTEGRLVTINVEEDIIAVVTSNAPYLEANDEEIKWFKPDVRQRKKELEKKQERRRARLSREEIKWEPMIFPHISKTFVSGGIIHPKRGTPRKGTMGAPDINDTSNAARELELPFEQGMCLERSQDFEDDIDCGLSPDLLRMVEQEEKQILPHEEAVKVVTLEEGKRGLQTSSTEAPENEVANIVPVPKKDRKVRMCVAYRDLNKASPKDNFPLPHIDTLVDNTVGYSLFSFIDGISGYNQIKMHFEDMEKTTFIALWGTFCYKVMSFGLKDAGATNQRAMVTLFHEMMHKEIEVYVDDMIAKSRTEEEHILALRKLFLRLRKFQLKLNPTKCTFGARSRKLLGFVVSERGIEIDSDKSSSIVTPYSDRPLILYLTVFDRSMGCVLGQYNDSERKEKVIYYLSKKFTECEMRYLPIEKLCCALIWTTRRLRQYMLYHTTLLISKLDPLNYMMESTALNGRMARWQILLSEFDIVYVSQKAVKGSAVADFLASRALEDYEPLNFDFPNEELMYVAATKEDATNDHPWKLNFNGASNAVGNGIGVVLVSPNGDHYPFTCKLDFDCTNNMAEYEACIMRLRAAIERKIRVLEVYGDSALVIYQLKGEWETRDPKLINYQKIVLGLIEEFDDITFNYLPRDENQMADALATLATLASMIKMSKQEDIKPNQMSIYEAPAHCYNMEGEESDDYLWYQDILRYVRNSEYPEQATENDKRTLRRLACDYVLDREILYKRRKDKILLRCVDAVEVKKILEEVHEGVCGTHANGFTMARQIMRFGYYWSTMEGDCINYAKTCHKSEQTEDSKSYLPEVAVEQTEDSKSYFPEVAVENIEVTNPIPLKLQQTEDSKSHLPEVVTEQIEATSLISLNEIEVLVLMPLKMQWDIMKLLEEGKHRKKSKIRRPCKNGPF
ncbi:reverse transcriptase [Gossypium australe]|uniref:Reverse transcriptase n=1 Tax=Gossypium australe TaxID=47621 RepID=A0A5B6WDK1_9ROSI|nr:reverse transcriptase [Gossypium australe]